MFQTEIIRFLQSFESPVLNFFFNIINSIGYSEFYIPLLMIIMFGISFRKGFYLLHVLLWTGFVTSLLKDYFGLPRPCDVDINVKLINKGYSNATIFDSMGATHFFGGLPSKVIEYYRNVYDYSFGFPSGHVSLTTALWGGIVQLFQKSWVKVLSIILIVLMPLTRMYLGKHFLIDVLGGIFVGIFFIFLFNYFISKSVWNKEIFSQSITYFPLNINKTILLIYFLAVPIIVFLILPQDNSSDLGNLFGLNIGFLLLSIKGIPLNKGTLLQKFFRILIALVFYIVFNLLLKTIGFDDVPLLEFIRATIVSFILMYGTVQIGIKFHLYRFE